MSSIQDQINRLEAIERRLDGGAIQAVTVTGADMAASIANRVINTGESADGSKFSPYSTKEVPAYFYYGKSRNASGEAKIKAAAKKREGVSYSEFRGFNNLGQVKNFSFTNELWRNFNVKKVSYSGGIYSLVLGGANKASEDKIGWMKGQEGKSIIAPNRVETGRAKQEILKFVIHGR